MDVFLAYRFTGQLMLELDRSITAHHFHDHRNMLLHNADLNFRRHGLGAGAGAVTLIVVLQLGSIVLLDELARGTTPWS